MRGVWAVWWYGLVFVKTIGASSSLMRAVYGKKKLCVAAAGWSGVKVERFRRKEL